MVTAGKKVNCEEMNMKTQIRLTLSPWIKTLGNGARQLIAREFKTQYNLEKKTSWGNTISSA